MIFKTNKFLKVSRVTFLTVVFLTAWSRPSVSSSPVTLRFGFFPVQEFLPYFVMMEKGFDKKNGIKFEEKSYQGGAAIINALSSNSVDVGFVGTVPILTAAERGLIPKEIVPVAASTLADPDHQGVGVLVTPSVKGWKDLKGKYIATVALDSLSGAAIKGRLYKEGIGDYKLVEIPFANMGLAVAGGNVAGATMSEPFLTQSLLRNDGKLLGWIIGGPPFESIVFTMIVFRGEFYRNAPHIVKAFLRAYLQAVEWMEKNKGEARSILARRLRLSQEVGKKMNLLHWHSDSRSDPALLEKMQTVLINVGMLKKAISAKQLYDETLLEEVMKEKR